MKAFCPLLLFVAMIPYSFTWDMSTTNLEYGVYGGLLLAWGYTVGVLQKS